MRFVSAAVGRTESAMWERDGLPLPFPPGWAYYKDLLPYATDDALIDRVLAAVTPEHVRAGWILGSPQEVAAQLRPYLELELDWVAPFDYLPVVGDPADAPQSLGWMIELCSELKRTHS